MSEGAGSNRGVAGENGKGHRTDTSSKKKGLSGAENTDGPSSSKAPSNLTLHLHAVEDGSDTRTSLMVRNIPNKYSQSMFLTEIQNGGFKDKITFFYLPIDFKNRCNRGYCFIDFHCPQDIALFYKQYNGVKWKNFNSDKICAITYARIQGKLAMCKRFENSELMEKEKEYRPRVFEKGVEEGFPFHEVGETEEGRGSTPAYGGDDGADHDEDEENIIDKDDGEEER